MTEEQKRIECQRICGNGGRKGIHRMFPEICPFLADKLIFGKDAALLVSGKA